MLKAPESAKAAEIRINFESLLKQGLGVIDVRYKEYEVTKETFKYVVTFIDTDRDSFYADMLKNYLKRDIQDKNVYDLWIRILRHKLQMSESLDRDISIKVAALDYVETVGIE
jgi:hypothetical protein